MFKIIDRRHETKIPEELPFFTTDDDVYYMYVKLGDKVMCVDLSDGELGSTKYDNIKEAVNCFGAGEEIVSVEMIIY